MLGIAFSRKWIYFLERDVTTDQLVLYRGSYLLLVYNRRDITGLP
jgi:hypothetical protein